MRVAVVSDVHGGLAALEAVIADLKKTSPDLVVHGGDLVVNGPSPNAVVETIRELGWPGVVGNTDEMLWCLDDLSLRLEEMPKLTSLLRAMYEDTAPYALEQLTEDNLAWLRALPQEMEVDGVWIVHATPKDLWRAPLPGATDDELAAAYRDVPNGDVIYGHVHRPFVRTVAGVTYANAGSVGLCWDGDRRASYLLVDHSSVTLRRVEYDLEAELRAMRGMPRASWLTAMRQKARFVQPL